MVMIETKLKLFYVQIFLHVFIKHRFQTYASINPSCFIFHVIIFFLNRMARNKSAADDVIQNHNEPDDSFTNVRIPLSISSLKYVC